MTEKIEGRFNRELNEAANEMSSVAEALGLRREAPLRRILQRISDLRDAEREQPKRSTKTLSHVRPAFVECPACTAKLGSPTLCRECIERRELYTLLSDERVCQTCQGVPDPECLEHGR